MWSQFLKTVSQILMPQSRQHLPIFITHGYSGKGRNAGEKGTIVTDG